MSKGLKLDKRGKLEIPEVEVQRAGDDLMQTRGWTMKPQPVNLHCPHCGANIPVPGANEGQPDRLYLKSLALPSPGMEPDHVGAMIYVEYKKLGQKPTREQRLYHAALRREGFTVLVIDRIEALSEWMGVKLGSR